MLRPPNPTARLFADAFTFTHWACWGRTHHALALVATVLFTTSSDPGRAGEWQNLFDGKTLEGWKVTDFAEHGEVDVENGRLILHSGMMLTGVSWTNTLPKIDYEVSLEAMKLDGGDFFCGLTFPVQDSFCTFIVGGWGGGVVGLSSIDGMDASENETTKYMKFDSGRWHRLRLRVVREQIEAWIVGEKIGD